MQLLKLGHADHWLVAKVGDSVKRKFYSRRWIYQKGLSRAFGTFDFGAEKY